MSDTREAIVISTNGKTVDIRPKGGNATLRNIPFSGGNAKVGQTVFYQTISGRRVALSSPSETDVSGSSGGSLNVYTTTSTNIQGASPDDILAAATYRADKVADETLLKSSAVGFLALGSAAVGKSGLTYDPSHGWREGSNLSLVSSLQSSLAFSTSEGATGITGTFERVSIAADFGFGRGFTDLSGVALVSPYGGLGVNQYPSAPLTGAGEMEQLRLINTSGQRFAGFSVDETGNLSITAQNGRILLTGQTKTQHLIADTASISRLRAGSLLVDRQSVLCGETIAAERGAFIAFDFTVPVAGGSVSLIIEEPADSTTNVFRDGAYVLISKIFWTDSTAYVRKKCWGKVTFRRRLPGGSPPMQEYWFVRDTGIPGDLAAGEIVAHDGASNVAIQFGKDSGLYMITSTGGTSTPSVVIYSWEGHPEDPSKLKRQLETSSNKVVVSDLTFTGNGIDTGFGARLYFGSELDYHFSQPAIATGIDATDPGGLNGSMAFMRAWGATRTGTYAGITARRTIDSRFIDFRAGHYIFDEGDIDGGPLTFLCDVILPGSRVEPGGSMFFGPWRAHTRMVTSTKEPTSALLAEGDLWLTDTLKFYLGGAVRKVLAPTSIPVLPTGAGKTVDDVIAALQAIGAVTQS